MERRCSDRARQVLERVFYSTEGESKSHRHKGARTDTVEGVAEEAVQKTPSDALQDAPKLSEQFGYLERREVEHLHLCSSPPRIVYSC